MAWPRRRRIGAGVELMADPATPLEAMLVAATESRSAAAGVLSIAARPIRRNEALQLSVVNRSRDLIAGTLAGARFERTSTWGITDPTTPPRELGPGWLERPDPLRSRAAWISATVDDLLFYGWSASRVTVTDPNGYPVAIERLVWPLTTPPIAHPAHVTPEGNVRTFPHTAKPDWWQTTDPITGAVREYSALRVITFESPMPALLDALNPLWIAARLEATAARFATAAMPIGWLKQTGGVAQTTAKMQTLAAEFETALNQQTIAYLNQWLDYHESQTDPSRLQLVESRSYADVSMARLCNVPAFLVNAAEPGASMTYRTAAWARFDLIDFGLAPYIACLEQTLSGPNVTPTGTTVTLDLESFLRTTQLAAAGTPVPADSSPAAAPTAGAAP